MSVLAFHHKQPAYQKHVIVIPEQHLPSFVDLGSATQESVLDLLLAVSSVARDMVETEGACRVITNLGRYQDSKHLHFHVVSGDRLS